MTEGAIKRDNETKQAEQHVFQIGKRTLLLLILWPIILALIILIGNSAIRYFSLHQSKIGSKAKPGTPERVVKTLWEAEDRMIDEWTKRPGVADVLSSVTEKKAKTLQKQFRLVDERRVDSVDNISPTEVHVTTTLKLMSEIEDNLEGKVKYVVVKEAEKWKVVEARLECSCNNGKENCYKCNGSGQEPTFSLYGSQSKICENCKGKGHVTCSSCDGKGWTDILGPMLLREYQRVL